MRVGLLVCLLVCVRAYASSCPANQPKAPGAIEQAEQSWAKALELHDVDALGCVLADEFQDTDPDGKVHDRAATLAAVSTRKPGSNHLSELQAHVDGNMGYIRGLATLVDLNGATRAKVRFTDIYIYRDGRWQCVAGQESMVNEKSP